MPELLNALEGTIRYTPGNSGNRSQQTRHFCTIKLLIGRVFLFVPTHVTVETLLARAELSAGAMLTIERSDGLFRIQSYCAPDRVNLVSGRTQIATAEGQEVVIADHEPTQADALPTDGIGRRRLEARQLSTGFSVILADFFIFSAMSNMRMLKSPHSPSERRLLERLVRTAAAVDSATSRRGGPTGADGYRIASSAAQGDLIRSACLSFHEPSRQPSAARIR